MLPPAGNAGDSDELGKLLQWNRSSRMRSPIWGTGRSSRRVTHPTKPRCRILPASETSVPKLGCYPMR